MNKRQDLIDMYLSGLSTTQIANASPLSTSSVRAVMISAGVLRGRPEAVRLAGTQGRLGSGMRGTKRFFTNAHKRNISKAKKGVGKGFSFKPNGYVEITIGESKGRLEHAVIMERRIGRQLLPHECVHHINQIRSDNRIENLKLMTRKGHAALHAKENIKNRSRDGKGRFV